MQLNDITNVSNAAILDNSNEKISNEKKYLINNNYSI